MTVNRYTDTMGDFCEASATPEGASCLAANVE